MTQSERGMTLVARDGEAIHVPAHPVKVRDVSGAGDTVAAVLAVMLAAGADWDIALRAANAGAAVAVSKKGTASVTLAELRRKILPHAFLAAEEKIVVAGGDLTPQLAEWRAEGHRIGFTNGCFDILHPGHVKVLTRGARRLRPADRRAQQRCLGAAAEGRDPPGAGRARPRRSAGRARSGRSGGDLR